MDIQAINPNCQVVFIGAGPVAVFTAIQAKLLDPSAELALIDRFHDYARTQTLFIDPSSLKTICDLERIKKERPDYAAQVDAFAQLIFALKANKKVKINELETRLLQIAQDLHIAVHKGYTFQPGAPAVPTAGDLIGVEGIKQAFPHARLIIGSDGAHSKVREAVFHNDLKVDEGLQYTIAFKYWVKNESHPLNKLIAYPTHKVVGFTQEYVGKYDEERKATPITAQCFVDRETFEKFKDYRAGNPLPFDQLEAIDPALKSKIQTWLGVRREALGDSIDGAIQVYGIKLPLYQSREAVRVEEGLTFALAGDAFLGVPFFKSINIGLQCGSKLSTCIVKWLNPAAIPKKESLWKRIKSFIKSIFKSKTAVADSIPRPLKRYAIFADSLGNQQIRLARVKNFFLNFYQWFIDISSVVPWQVNRWRPYDLRRFTELDLY